MQKRISCSRRVREPLISNFLRGCSRVVDRDVFVGNLGSYEYVYVCEFDFFIFIIEILVKYVHL